MAENNTHANYDYSIFIFRRDLRIHDNPALNFALTHSKYVVPVFIFDPEQIGATNQWRSIASIKFMLESLLDLNNQLLAEHAHLHFYRGNPAKVISTLAKVIKGGKQPSKNTEQARTLKICVCFNADYTPFSKKRDAAIVEAVLKLGNCECRQFHDLLLKVSPMEQPYKKFTPFFNAYNKPSYVNAVVKLTTLERSSERSSQGSQHNPQHNTKFISMEKLFPIQDKLQSIKITTVYEKTPELTKIAKQFEAFLPKELISGFDTHSQIIGGRASALKLLKVAAKTQKKYADTRDTLSISTTRLSAHNKFGTVSIREVYEVFAKVSKTLVQQLYWREFYYNLMATDPHALTGPYSGVTALKWNKSASDFSRWTTGTTGFPIVDAAMRELNATHYMHNRGRMIVASFLVKDLRINWRWGERYFATQLVDYDPAQNNYNWQWVAGTGPFAAPYFRVFNPWAQSAHHDPNADYIKKWIPALRELPAKVIHKWGEYCAEAKNKNQTKINQELITMVKKIINSVDENYPEPMCDHDEQTKQYLKMMKSK